jgi:serine/threonine protein kinase, bacterial
MPFSNGEIFAGFRILGLLGSGGMGEVYLAEHPRLPRRNALKVLPTDVSADPEYRARFGREADLASTLWHPHIVSVHDRGEHNGQLWISMDYVDGRDAGRLLVERYPAGMPVEHVVRIVTAVASALDYAHKQGLLHRDVKPANIMLSQLDEDDEQRILLADFGIARDVDDISGLTATNMTVGTVAYSAPEQLMGEEIDGHADQYSLAATAYHLLTGSQLFPHSNPAVVVSRHLTVSPPALAHARPELAALDPVLTVGLAKDRDHRFATCGDFACALAEHAISLTAASPVASTREAPIRRRTLTRRHRAARKITPSPKPSTGLPKRRWLAPTVSAAAVLLVAVVALAWHPWKSSRSIPSVEGASSTPTAPRTSVVLPSSPAPPPPGTNTITTTVSQPAQPYALPGCTHDPDTVTERPDTANLTCNRLHWIEGMTWTSWGPAGAEGIGTEQTSNCDPICATGAIFRNRVQVVFTGSTSAPYDSQCPAAFLYYTQVIVAYPDLTEATFDELLSDAFGLNIDIGGQTSRPGAPTTTATKYNGMFAIRWNDLHINCDSPNI